MGWRKSFTVRARQVESIAFEAGARVRPDDLVVPRDFVRPPGRKHRSRCEGMSEAAD